ncbi:peptidoglycan DD-metalloendopeptidase family protein [Clostridium sp. 'deep sea']|uniref:LysM peptidoglycan-binding domain-containing M23 family metallopeptidase n=1 Tax=Clostridium sp. 'deep sea' TaxID=2779445 RepID=UPI0018964146|nr:M23 family metallopeptidase [Clostridium sp. 'deep sea']QOR34122.1 peptidoglycan DD-metalloendopeptidase family protein [Clostridium sp. 'deep sea']
MKPLIILVTLSLLLVNAVAMPCSNLEIYDCLDDFLANWLTRTIVSAQKSDLAGLEFNAKVVDRSPLQVKKTVNEINAQANRVYLQNRSNQYLYRYQINKGDTLWGIAKRYNTTVNNIKNVNPTVNAKKLIVGSYIYLTSSSKVKLNFKWPLQGTITSPFGMRNNKLHKGLDIAANTGTRIKASATGIVLEAGWHNSYGFYVLVSHINGYQTRYAHCSKLLVKRGQQVSSQQTIALVGSTGKSTGPHVHFEIIKNSKHQNPINYLS